MKYHFFHIKHILTLGLIGGVFLILFSSCNPTKSLTPGQVFLQSNKIKIDNRKINKDEVEGLIKQKANKKILEIARFYLGVYHYWPPWRDNELRHNSGEPPVIYDSLLTQRTVKQLKIYLKNRGYFDSKVNFSTKEKGNKIKVKYHIETGEPYLIKSVDYVFGDEQIKSKSFLILRKTLFDLRPGNVFDIDVLDKQREKIKAEMKNLGYYYFNKDFIKYKVDCSL